MKYLDTIGNVLKVGDVVAIGEWDTSVSVGIIAGFTRCGVYLIYAMWDGEKVREVTNNLQSKYLREAFEHPPRKCWFYKCNDEWSIQADSHPYSSTHRWNPSSITRRILKIPPETLGQEFADKLQMELQNINDTETEGITL